MMGKRVIVSPHGGMEVSHIGDGLYTTGGLRPAKDGLWCKCRDRNIPHLYAEQVEVTKFSAYRKYFHFWFCAKCRRTTQVG